ncbi:MAG: hypothetical protein KBB16_03690 [Candidatus Pacebacteria bacterium]|nr:hypothetical protein [Candidatus Paceibacterota bacterium]
MQETKQKEIREIEDLLSRELDVLENAVSDENKALAICSREELWKLISRLNSTLLAERDAEVEKLKFILKDINSFEEDGEIGTLCEQGLSIISKLERK